MKICIFLSSRNIVPPIKTGGIEQSTYYLIRELIKRGHDVTLYTGKDSTMPGATINEISPYNSENSKINFLNHEMQVDRFYDLSALVNFFAERKDDKFDIIFYSNYIFYEILPFAKMTKKPILIQINYPHDRIYPFLRNRIVNIKNIYYVAVSEYVKKLMPGLSYIKTIYPVLDVNNFDYSFDVGEHLFFIGRICPDKGVHHAIKVAIKLGKKLIIAGRLDEEYKSYYKSDLMPYIDGKKIKYIGEIDFQTKNKIFRKSIATLFTSQWNEPFGIVQIESMAAGTPVISFDRAAAREIIKNGVSGYIVKDGDINAMSDAVAKAERINRKKIREYVEKKFSIKKEVDKFEATCRKIIGKK